VFRFTTGGRIIGVVLMTAGVGLFGTFTGYVSSWFVGQKNDGDEREKTVDTN